MSKDEITDKIVKLFSSHGFYMKLYLFRSPDLLDDVQVSGTVLWKFIWGGNSLGTFFALLYHMKLLLSQIRPSRTFSGPTYVKKRTTFEWRANWRANPENGHLLALKCLERRTPEKEQDDPALFLVSCIQNEFVQWSKLLRPWRTSTPSTAPFFKIGAIFWFQQETMVSSVGILKAVHLLEKTLFHE